MGAIIRPLYQCFAETRQGELMPLGPKWSERQAAEQIARAVQQKIIVGVERELGNPHVARVFSN